MPLELAVFNLGITLAIMAGLWVVSLLQRDASIVDLYWGPGFAVIAWCTCFLMEAQGARPIIFCTLVTVWAVRLSCYLYGRSKGKGEDPRYMAMREGRGAAFWWQSLYVVFGLQAVLMWLISMPIQVGMVADGPSGIVEIIGGTIAVLGLAVETIADRQLAAFKATDHAPQSIMNRGLWKFSRHPNYFGETLYTWGIFIFACGNPAALWTLWAPALMTFLILRVSGVKLLEERLYASKPGYAAYAATTSRFIPRPPQRDIG